MPIKYALYPNHLTDDPNDHLAVVQDQKPHTLQDIIDLMMIRGSTVTKSDILSVLEDFEATVEHILKDGGSVNTDLMKISASIPGVFVNRKDSFDTARHYVRLNVQPGSRLGSVGRQMEVEKVESDKPTPNVALFRDVMSETTNETLTPGGVGELEGNRLKLDEDDPDQGVFFLAEDGTETRVEKYIRNKPGNLIFMIPMSLTSGEYQIEVRALLHQRNDVRSGQLEGTLIVP